MILVCLFLLIITAKFIQTVEILPTKQEWTLNFIQSSILNALY